jgi:hypothetical protein
MSLQRLSQLVQAPVPFFFEGAPRGFVDSPGEGAEMAKTRPT